MVLWASIIKRKSTSTWMWKVQFDSKHSIFMSWAYVIQTEHELMEMTDDMWECCGNVIKGFRFDWLFAFFWASLPFVFRILVDGSVIGFVHDRNNANLINHKDHIAENAYSNTCIFIGFCNFKYIYDEFIILLFECWIYHLWPHFVSFLYFHFLLSYLAYWWWWIQWLRECGYTDSALEDLVIFS